MDWQNSSDNIKPGAMMKSKKTRKKRKQSTSRKIHAQEKKMMLSMLVTIEPRIYLDDNMLFKCSLLHSMAMGLVSEAFCFSFNRSLYSVSELMYESERIICINNLLSQSLVTRSKVAQLVAILTKKEEQD